MGLFGKSEKDKNIGEKIKDGADSAADALKSGAGSADHQFKKAVDGAGHGAHQVQHKAKEAGQNVASGTESAINKAQDTGDDAKHHLHKAKH